MDYIEPSNVLPRAVNGEYFAKGTKKCKVLGNLLNKDVENLKITAVTKLKLPLMKELGFAQVTHSDTRPQFTVQSVRQKFLVTG